MFVAAGTAAAAPTAPVAVYGGSDGSIHVVGANGSTSTFEASASAVGPLADLDGDGRREAPYVTSNGALKTIDSGGETTTLVSGGVRASKTRLGVADVDGDGTLSVLYVNTQDSGHVYGVEAGGSPREVVAASASAVVGYADMDGDGTTDVVFLGSSSTVKYASGGSVTGTGYSSVGSNNGIGVGAAADYDGDGTARAAVVDGSNQLKLVAADGSTTVLARDAAKAPAGAADIAGDDSPDVLYTTTNGTLGYATASGQTGTLASGVAPAVGVAGHTGPGAPRITNVSLANPDGRTLEVSVTADRSLDSLVVDLSGPDGTTLTKSEFAVTGEYTYTATYTPDADGEYTATVETAAADGRDGASGQQASATVRTAQPTVSDATVNAADGSDVVGDGDEFVVSAVVTGAENVTVTADASAYGAGTVHLSRADGNVYRTTVTVDAEDGSAGTHDVTVRARTPVGNTDADTGTGPVLDTRAPTADAGRDRNATPGMVVGFDADGSSDDTRIVNATWTFPSGTTKHGEAVTHAFAETGTYTVRLRVRDAAGHTATDTRTVRVREASAVATDANVSVESDGASATARVRNATSRRPVSLPVPADADAPAALSNVTLTTSRESFALTFTPSATPLNATPALDASLPAEALVYYDIGHTVNDANVSAALFHASVNASAVPSAETVALYRYHDGAWTRLHTTVENVTDGRVHVSARTTGFSVYAIGARQPQFAVTNATLGAQQADAGTGVPITVTVRNSGSANGTATLPVSFDGETVATRNVSVDAGTTRTVTLTVTPQKKGAYDVAVADTQAGELTVTSPASTVMQALRIVGLLAALCMAAAGFLYLRDGF
ncbi:PKD domain-containing protein [Halarchaeum sp. P4]|uniref:PKD domain-containing protein n=1 Tax=Halarchaeum sp. P4 TaxID=3421639 RepID=UPI003EC03E1B